MLKRSRKNFGDAKRAFNGKKWCQKCSVFKISTEYLQQPKPGSSLIEKEGIVVIVKRFAIGNDNDILLLNLLGIFVRLAAGLIG